MLYNRNRTQAHKLKGRSQGRATSFPGFRYNEQRFVVMSRPIRLFALVIFAIHPLVGSACIPLPFGQTSNSSTSLNHPACYLVRLGEGEASQLILTQEADLAINVTKESVSILVDGFEFGPETATIYDPGLYRVEILPVKSRGATIRLSMSRTSVPLQQAALWRESENWATRSKQTGNPDDIARSLQLWQQSGDISAVARTQLKTGDALFNVRELSGAREAYEEAWKLCRGEGDVRCSAEAANNSGLVSRDLGEFSRSLERLTQAIGDWRQLKNREAEAKTLSNLGLLYRQVSDYQQAISSYEQAETILRPLDSVAYGRILNNLGLCYQNMAELNRANDYFSRALARQIAGHSARDEVIARLNLGRNYLLEGHMETALLILNRALEQATDQGYRQVMADTLNNLGQTLIEMHRYEPAKSRLEEALKLHRALGDRRIESSDLHFLGVVALARDDIAAAQRLFLDAISLRRSCELRDPLTDSLFALATLKRKAGDQQATRDLADQAIEIAESIRQRVPSAALRASFYVRKRRFFDLLVDVSMASDNPQSVADGLFAAERGHGRALLDLLAEGSIQGSIPKELIDRRASVQRQIDLLSVRLGGISASSEPNLRRRVDELVAEDQEIEARMRQLAGTDVLGHGFVSAAELQSELQHNLLPADSALLEYHLGPERSYLWFMTTTDIRVFRLPPRGAVEAQITNAVDPFGKILERRRSPQKQLAFERAMHILSATLLGPLRDTSLPERLIIVPDGGLHRVPFAALQLPRTGRPLGLVHDLIQIPAAAYLKAGKQPQPISDFPRTFLAFADPVFSPDDPRVELRLHTGTASASDLRLPRLPFNAEIATVESLVPPNKLRILRGFDANLEMARRLPLSEYAVLHFSTHALIDDRIPELSRVALTMVERDGRPVDGFLRSYQLSQLHLNGSVFVLSACDTALGKQVLGEGLAGLTASLFHAGAAQLVLTLAEVDAEASSAFLQEAYRHVFAARNTGKPALSMEHALTLARRAMARSSRWSDPYYWGSFAIYGRPTKSSPQTPPL
jgi:CHAT domain-containing protein/tetratricopeptide (TPR) repeat protein